MASRNLLRRVFVAVGLLTALGGAIAVGLPWYVRRELDAAAQAEGVNLSIDHVGIGWSEIRLTRLAATMADLPGVRVTLEEAVLTREGLAVTQVTGSGLDLTLEGAGEPFLQALATRKTGSLPRAVLPAMHVLSGRLQWIKPFGETSSLEAASLRVEMPAGKNFGEEIHATVGKLSAATSPGRELGPWTARLDKTADLTSVAVELVPDAPGTATLTRTVAAPPAPSALAPTSWRIELHKQKLSRLGVPGAMLGIPAGIDPSVDLSFHHGQSAFDKVEGGLALNLDGARFVSMTMPTDVHVDLAWEGDPAKPVPITVGTFAIVPFAGDVTGTVQPLPGGFRTDLTLRSRPVSCAQLAGAQAAEAGPLGALAQAAGLTRVVGGDAVLEGKLFFDSSAPDKTKIEVSPKSNCSLSFLK